MKNVRQGMVVALLEFVLDTASVSYISVVPSRIDNYHSITEVLVINKYILCI